MSRTIRLGVGLSVAASLFAGALSAQDVARDERFAAADSLHARADYAGALALLREVIAETPHDIAALWKAAREAIALGVVTESHDAQKIPLDTAIALAERALALDTTHFTAEYWLVAAQGMRAKHAEALLAARLGTSVYERSRSLLQRDSLHPASNHALGALNLEVMRLSRIKRFLAVTILGNRAFRDMSWENAEFYLGRSVGLDSSSASARLDLGRTFFYQRQFVDARVVLEDLLEQPFVDPTDVVFHEEASRYIARIP